MSRANELWASEYGADCFSIGDLGREEGGKYENGQLTGVWWPFYIDGKQIGWAQIAYDGSTLFGIKLMKGHTIQVKDEGKAARRSESGRPHTDVEVYKEDEDDDA